MHSHHEHKFTFHKALHDKMGPLYIFHAMLTFAKNLIGVFVPIFLYKLGFSLTNILAYYLIPQSILMLLTMPITSKIVKNYGFKKSLLISIIIYLVHISLINLLTANSTPLQLIITSGSFGIYLGVFWPVFHSEIALNGSNKHRSSQWGTIQILTILVSTLAPLIGGYLLQQAESFKLVFLFSATIIIIGMIPLLLSPDKRIKYYNINYSDYLKFLKEKKYTRSKITFSFDGINHALMVFIWPVIIFTLLDKNFFAYGILITAISFINIIILLYVKKHFDHKNKSKTLHKSSIPLGAIWLIKSSIFLLSMPFIYLIEATGKILNSVFDNLYMSIFYTNAKKIGYMKYIIMREFYLCTTKTIFMIFLIIILSYTGDNIVILSAIAASGLISSLGLGMFKEEKQ